MLDEHSPDMMRILAPYYETMGRNDRAVSDMDAEFTEAQEAREQEYAEKKAEQQQQREEREARREELRKQIEEQQAEQEGEEHKPNAWLEHEAYGAEEMSFAPQDDDEPVATPARAGPPDASRPEPAPAPAPDEPAPEPSHPRGPMRHARFDPNASEGDEYDADDEYFLNRTWLR